MAARQLSKDPESEPQKQISRSEWRRLFDEAKTLQHEKTTLEAFEAKWHRALQRQARAGLGHLIDENLQEWHQNPLECLLRYLLDGLGSENDTVSHNSGELERRRLSLKAELFQKALKASNHAFIHAFWAILGNDELRYISYEDLPLPEGGKALHQAILYQSPLTSRIISLYPSSKLIFVKKDELGRTPLHIAVESDVTTSTPGGYRPHDVVRYLIKKNPDALLKTDAAGMTPYQLRVRAIGTSLDDESDETLEYIRSYILRTLKPDEALRALYPAGQERVIELNLQEIESGMLETYLDFMTRQFTWAPVLKEVSLPSWTCKPSTLQPVKGKDQRLDARADTRPLSGVLRVFRWLRGTKVRKIIKLVVQGDDLESGYEESIVNALEGFEVEIWDWKRLDIPSNAIASSSSALRVVQLYYSGDETVLQDWASSQGFFNQVLFPELEVVSIVPSPDTNTGQTRERILVAFDANKPIERWGPDLTIEIHGDAAANRAVQKESVMTSHHGWPPLARSFWRRLVTTFPIHSSKEFQRVKVAILHDGVNPLLELTTDIQPEWVGMSFQSLRSDGSGISPWYISSMGHGTQVANIIATLCPCVKFYIAKIHMLPSSQTNHPSETPNCSSIRYKECKALAWALAAQVDVIYLGLNLSRLEVGESERLHQLKDIIYKAERQNIVIFNTPSDFSVSPSRPKLFPRGPPCLTIGIQSNWMDLDALDFIFSGDMPEQYPLGVGETRGISGPSIAAAHACGLGALLLHLQRLVTEDPCRSPYEFLVNAYRYIVHEGRFHRTVDIEDFFVVLGREGRPDDDGFIPIFDVSWNG